MARAHYANGLVYNERHNETCHKNSIENTESTLLDAEPQSKSLNSSKVLSRVMGIVVDQAIRGSCGKYTTTTHIQQKGEVHKEKLTYGTSALREWFSLQRKT